jgi:hypothetical protein
MHGHVRRTAVQCVSVLSAAGFLLAPAGMTRDHRLVAVVQDWVDVNDLEERCSGADRLDLIAQLRDLKPTLSEIQARTLLAALLSELRPTQQRGSVHPPGSASARSKGETKKQNEVYRASHPPPPPRPRPPRPPC